MSTDHYIGTCLDGRFQILSLIAEGGTSYLYLAKHLLMDKQVAVKVLKLGAAASEQYLQRFQNEAKTATLLSHPNIAGVDAFGVTDKGPFIAMDYVDGQPLSKMLETHGNLSPAEAVRLFGKVADALAHAHRQGVVHRDLKPSNIMVTKSGEPKIVDFGIAKLIDLGFISASQHLTQTGQLLGTPAYMSPEQISGKKADARTDIYSLGCVLYEALTGGRPFDGNTPLETMYKHLNDPVPTAPQLPADLQTLLLKALQKNPDDRQQDMERFAFELADCKDLEKSLTAGKKPLPNSLLIAVVSLVVLFPIIAFAFLLKPAAFEEPPPVRPVVIPKKLITSVKDVIKEGANLMATDASAAVKKFELAVQMAEEGLPYDDEPQSTLYTRVGRMYLHVFNNVDETEKWFNRALKRSDKFEEPKSGYRAAIMQDFGDLHAKKYALTRDPKQLEQALAYFKKAESIYTTINDPEAYGWLLGKIGSLYSMQPDWKKAEETQAECLRLIKESADDKGYWVGAANYLGGTFEAQQKWAEALDIYRETVDWAKTRSPFEMQMLVAQQIYVARNLARLNRQDESRQVYREAIKNMIADKEYSRIPYDAAEYATLLKGMGKPDEARVMRRLAKDPTMPLSEIP